MRSVKFQGHIESEICRLVEAPDDRIDVKAAIVFTLKNGAEAGEFTGRQTPLPVYAAKLFGTSTCPPLTFYYCFTESLAVVVAIKITQPDEQGD
jgi:hypothetical protein